MTSTTHADASTPSLPTGTVTFLFTDIEGSTRLWESQQAAMQAALPRHDALVRQCIAHHGGHVFKTGGDAFCAAFHTAPDALAAALESQRAIHAERWPESAKLRVRMALHTGAAEFRDGDYFGAPLNRVARLLAAGHGGQTLLSESTHDLCRDHLPPLATAKALGEHGLKDLARREAVFQLCHPDLPQSFPPLKTTLAPLDRETPSIAVLPFINMSRDEENEYFADGLSEELLNVLAKIRGLRVASRTSAFFFKGKDIDIPTVAQKLNVATVLEGSVRKSGKRVRITAQLIQVATDSHLWSDTYDRELDDIFAVQDDIAQSVVKELRAALLGEGLGAVADAKAKAEVQAAATGRADNPEAYRLYLQGRYFIDRMTQVDLARSVDYFRQAIALDPDFALGWTGLSQAYSTQAGYGWAPVAEGYERARDAAKRALALAPDLAEGHVRLGTRSRGLRLGLESRQRRISARVRAGARQRRRAARCRRHDADFRRPGCRHRTLAPGRGAGPAELVRSSHAGLALLSGGPPRRGDGGAEDVARPQSQGGPGPLLSLRHKPARKAGRPRRSSWPSARPCRIFACWGSRSRNIRSAARKQSDAAMAQLIERHGNEAAYQIAEAYAWRGERDRVFEWLERAYTQRDPGLAMTSSDPFFRPMHDDPRWLPFLKKMGFPSR